MCENHVVSDFYKYDKSHKLLERKHHHKLNQKLNKKFKSERRKICFKCTHTQNLKQLSYI